LAALAGGDLRKEPFGLERTGGRAVELDNSGDKNSAETPGGDRKPVEFWYRTGLKR